MRRLGMLAAVVAALVAVAASAAGATPPLRTSFELNATFPYDACGFPATVTYTETGLFTLFQSRDGTTVRELDTYPGATATYTAGERTFTSSISYPVHTTYPEGAYVGAPAIVTMTGMFGKAPGAPAAAGSQTIVSSVFAFGDYGGVLIPLVDFAPVVVSHGAHAGDAAASICAALAP